MKKILLVLAVVLLTLNNVALGQRNRTYEDIVPVKYRNVVKEPKSWKDTSINSIKQVVSIRDFSMEEQVKPEHVGFREWVDCNMKNSGQWDTLDNGDRIWRVAIFVPNVTDIEIYFKNSFVHDSCQLSVYAYNRQQIVMCNLQRNFERSPFKKLIFTGLILYDTAVIEYYVPKNINDFGNIQIDFIGFTLKSFRKKTIYTKGSDSQECFIDINCSEGQNWQNEKRAVAMLQYYHENNRIVGTGFLVNNNRQDYSPYFLTAKHVVDSCTNYDSITFTWNYEDIECNSGITDMMYGSMGAELLACGDISDFALLRLINMQSMYYAPYYLGWDARNILDIASGISIHRPKKNQKKISTTLHIVSDSIYLWKTHWDSTENGYGLMTYGSSGAPLINNNRHVIGQAWRSNILYCDSAYFNQSYFGKFNLSWDYYSDSTKQLKYWLDPDNTGIKVLEGISPIDLYVKDCSNDDGSEPSLCGACYDSPDITFTDVETNQELVRLSRIINKYR